MKTILIPILLLSILALSYTQVTFTSFNGDFNSLEGVSGSIPVSQLINVANFYGCKKWEKDVCLQCSDRFFFNKNGVCCQVNQYCRQFNKAEGVCESCYQGYSIVDGKCKRSDIDSGCVQWNGNQCTQCSKRWYFDQSGVCKPVSDLCSTWNSNGNCLSCYGGYVLNQFACVIDPKPFRGQENVLCRQWEGNNCRKCSERAYFNSNGLCIPVDDQCQTFDSSNGNCLSCYGGYTLRNSRCIASPIQAPKDLGCSKWNSNFDICLKCSERYYFDSSNVCRQIDNNCRSWNDNNGHCLSCYDGYILNNGKCQLAPQQKVSDVGCALWDWKKQQCLRCSEDWVFNPSGICIPVSDFCATYDTKSGLCLTCYKGYVLNQGRCQLAPQQKVSDVGCAQWDWDQQKCLKCSNRWAFNNNGLCVPVSDQCSSSDISGNCLTCFQGYRLNNGKCELSPDQKVSDVGCALWDWKKQQCLRCSEGWAFNDNGKCSTVSDSCATYDRKTGVCISCYEGYVLNNGKCQLAPQQKVSDVGCALWDWKKQQCLRCSEDWVFNPSGICIPVSDFCATYDTKSGLCLTCYKGYVLNQGRCQLAPQQKVSDVGCAQWDWDQQKCLKCSNRWAFNNNGLCVPVSDSCALYNQSGHCTGCYNGYVLNQQGQCQQGNSLCKSTNSNGACSECYTGYILNYGNCVPLSKLANLALYYAQCCPQRLEQLKNLTNKN